MHKFEPVDVSIVVPCRNEIAHIGKFLDSVFLQRSDGINLEVVISDGMSDDGTRQVLRHYEQTR